MAIVGASFLSAISRALARIHVEHNDPRRTPLCTVSIHWPGARSSTITNRACRSVNGPATACNAGKAGKDRLDIAPA
jgi:hypothetical protein